MNNLRTKSTDLPNVISIGSVFLGYNPVIKSVNLPKLEEAYDGFLLLSLSNPELNMYIPRLKPEGMNDLSEEVKDILARFIAASKTQLLKRATQKMRNAQNTNASQSNTLPITHDDAER